MEIKSQAAQ